jgi:lipopolysaccharide transport protein LptA
MAIAADSIGPGSRLVALPPAGDREVARERAFRRAQRHTLVVRTLRFALPLAAVALLGSYGLFVRHTVSVGNGQLSVGPVELSTEYLTMNAPRYEGYGADGSHFVVNARSAVQDLSPNAPIKLFDIDGKIAQANSTTTNMTATRGSYDSKADQFELWEKIDIRSSDGMTARLTRATVLTKENKIISDEPVEVEMPAGTLRGNTMVLLQKERQVTFDRGVVALLRPQARDDKAQKPQAKDGKSQSPQVKEDKARASPPSGGRLIGAGDAPVEVTAPSVRIDDNRKIALFSENVRAVQGESTLTARELEARYEGSAGGAGEPAVPTGGGRLKHLLARDNVVIIRGQDRIMSDSAEFDTAADTSALKGSVVVTSGADRQANGDEALVNNKTDTVLLTGAVVVQQGKNVLWGRRLFVDQRAGQSQLSAPADASTAAGRIAARFVQTEQKQSAKGAPQKSSGEAEGGALATFRTDPNAPVDIQADVLNVNDRERTATFHGDVYAVQGEFTIRTAELIASYTGQAGLSLGEAASGKSPPQLQKIYARKKVIVTSKTDQSATGDWAEFDMKGNTVTLGGDVVLSQARNIVRGPKLVIDMTTGQSRMETGRVSAPPAAPANSASDGKADKPVHIPDIMSGSGTIACGGRMCAVFYPKDATDAAKRGAGEAARRLGVAKEQKDQKEHKDQSPEEPLEASSSWTSVTKP